MVERDAGLPPSGDRIRVGIDLGDVVEESDGDLMGDGDNIAAPLKDRQTRHHLPPRTPTGKCVTA